jgi:thiamine-monophosphate kinase
VFRTESEFVDWLRSCTLRGARGLRLGIGDDAAVIEEHRGRDLILKTDMSIEGVHFRRQLHPPRSVGHRALARSLSDVAAMGGTPHFALISLAVSKRATHAWIKQVYAGIFALAAQFNVVVVGGDTAVVPGSTLMDVIVVGEVGRGRAILRSGAQPGDQIYVSGRLGLSALGLRLLRSGAGRTSEDAGAAQALRAHLHPQPRCALGVYLANRRLASALIDISDGLSTDLDHLCQASSVGATVWVDRLPLPQLATPGRRSVDPLRLALHGGEDYELLFTVPPRKVAEVPASFHSLPLHHIGEIHRARQLVLICSDGKPVRVRPEGYDHFRQ